MRDVHSTEPREGRCSAERAGAIRAWLSRRARSRGGMATVGEVGCERHTSLHANLPQSHLVRLRVQDGSIVYDSRILCVREPCDPLCNQRAHMRLFLNSEDVDGRVAARVSLHRIQPDRKEYRDVIQGIPMIIMIPQNDALELLHVGKRPRTSAVRDVGSTAGTNGRANVCMAT